MEVQWDHGGANSYRMGAEGKYDLDLTGEEPLVPPPPTEGQENVMTDDEVMILHVCTWCSVYMLVLHCVGVSKVPTRVYISYTCDWVVRRQLSHTPRVVRRQLNQTQ